MFLGFLSANSRNLLVRGLHIGKHFKSPIAEDIIFKALCANDRQKRWKLLNKLTSNLSSSLLFRLLQEFRSSPQLTLEVYRRIGGGEKVVLSTLEGSSILIHAMVGCKNYDDALFLLKELMIAKGHTPLQLLEALVMSFDESSSSISVFDTLVRACTQIGTIEGAHEVIKKSIHEGYYVSIHGWNNFLNHLLKVGEIGRFWAVYRDMITVYGYYENVNTFNLLIYALCMECKICEAFSVLYKMFKAGIVPNVVTFNMVIGGACKADDLRLAKKLFQKMGEMSGDFISPNVVTFNCLINGYCKNGKPHLGEQFLDTMAEMKVKPNVRTYATLIDGYARFGRLDKAFRLCNDMVGNGLMPNSAVYNSFLHCLYMEGEIDEALSLLSNMVKNNVKADRFTRSIIEKGLCMNGLVSEALKLHRLSLEETEANHEDDDAFSFNVLINHLLKIGNISLAEQMLCSMFVRGLVPDIVTYGTLINGYFKHGELNRAALAYSDMVDSGKNPPNLVVLNSILGSLNRENRFESSRNLAEEMKRSNMYDSVTYNTLLDGYFLSGNIEGALELFSLMRREAFLNKITCNIMVKHLCAFGLFSHAKEVVEEMFHRGMTPDVITYTTLLTSLGKKGSSEEVVKMHDYLILRGVEADGQTYEAIVRPCIMESGSFRRR